MTAAKKTAAKKVKVSAPYAKKVYIAKGKSVKLSANQKVTYKSKNKKVVTVTSKGVVKGKKVGKTKIVVTAKKNKKKKATITVKVMKKAVKKVKLNKKTASLKVGGSLSLKKTVSAKKGASKNVYWKSSKSSVATVSQKGVVKAKKAGKATITVQATDGSKKKATCKVTVTGSATKNVSDDILGVTVMNANALKFTLAKAHTLRNTDIVLMKKALPHGLYQQKIGINTVYSSDGKNYTVVFAGDSSVAEEEFVKVSIPSLSGVKVKEIQYLKPLTSYEFERVFVGTVGERESWSTDFYRGNGYSSYTVTGLPKGITCTQWNGELDFRGTPVSPGMTEATIKAVDERGNKCTSKIKFCIGSSDTIAACTSTRYGYSSPKSTMSWGTQVEASGGSGTYTYTLPQNEENFTLSESGWIRASVTKPGTYKVTVQVADAANPAIRRNVVATFKIVPGYTVSGTVRDALGNAMKDGAAVYFTNNDYGVPQYYDTDQFFSDYVYCDYEGKYSVVVPAGNMDIKVTDNYSNAIVYDFRRTIAKTTALDFKLPLYPVTFVDSQGNGITDRGWYDAKETARGSKEKIYLQSGTYELHTNSTPKYRAKFTVGKAAIRVTAKTEG